MRRGEDAQLTSLIDEEADGRVTWRPPRWAWPVTLVICLAGIAVASYLTYAHYTDASVLACSDKGVVNCARVTTSEQSHFLGMPVAVLGLAYFLGMTALCSPWAWRRPERLVRLARLAAAGGGVVFVLYLLYAELFIIDAICLYCTIVHGLTVLLFAAIAFATAGGVQRPKIADYDDYVEDYEDDYEDSDELADEQLADAEVPSLSEPASARPPRAGS
jgi:uncharacterized membrane protein